ncbi:MAG TPA: ferrochelatase [Candidatus Limnocylindrales bacterium]|nr:ferrochelatase [Candidatus Limnocylindrales bacterium]
MSDSAAPVGVVLMTYGSPASLEDVPRYIRAVRGGRDVPAEVVDEMRRRYRIIGGSPLIGITRAQADALQQRLGDGWMVRAGMRFSEPYIAEVVSEMADAGVRRVVGVIMSPQFSPLLMGGYRRALDDAHGQLGPDAPPIQLAGAWHTDPSFIAALAARIDEALGRLPPAERERAPVLLTAHSLPRRVAEQEPDYLAQLEQTARLVAGRAGLADSRWTFCWQSAGHEPGEWMKPDFADLMPELAAAGHRSVVVAPIQFLADHLEILYDVDVGAREQAEAAGLRFERIESLNVDKRFIDALAAVVSRTSSQASARA